MRRRELLLSLAAACTACLEQKTYELPALAPHRSMVVVIEAGDGAGRVIAAADDSALLSLWTGGKDDETRLAVFLYDDTLDALRLAPGVHERSETGRTVPDLRAEKILEAKLIGADLSSWTELPAGPEWVSAFRIPGNELIKPCRPVPRSRRAREFCWTEPKPIDTFNTQSVETGGNVACEDDETWLYFSTSRWTSHPIPGSPYLDHQSVHARVRLNEDYSIDLNTLEPLFPPANLEDEVGEIGGAGAVGPPVMRHDGLELYFASDRPDKRWEDNELYVSARASTRERFAHPLVLDSVVSTSTVYWDPVNWISLLGDDKTIVYVDDPGVTRKLTIARRDTTTPGDRSFRKLTDVFALQAPLTDLGSPAMSCDGFHFFYHYITRDGYRQPAVAEIVSYDPLTFGPSRDLPLRINDGTGVDALFGFYELPDCSGLLVSTSGTMYFAEAVPCSR